MQLLDKDHPIWKVARLAVVGGVLFAIFYCGRVYNNPIEAKDLITIATTLVALGGFDLAKAVATKE